MPHIFRGKPKAKHRPPLVLSDRQARNNLGKIVPVSWVNGVGHRWPFVRETRTASGTIGWVYRDPFNANIERVYVIDFKDGTLKNIGPACKPRPARQPALPPPPRMELLPPPPGYRKEGNRVAEMLGELLLRHVRRRVN